jgi:hypothetical protein
MHNSQGPVEKVRFVVIASGDDPPSGGLSKRGNLEVACAAEFEIATSHPRNAIKTRDDSFEGFSTSPQEWEKLQQRTD